jgi:hypothetical protein
MTDQKIFQRLQEFKEKKKKIDFIWADYQQILEKIEEQLRTVGLKSLKGLPREEKLRYWQKAKESE